MASKLQTVEIVVLAVVVALLSFQGWKSSRDIEKYAFVLMGGDDAAPNGEFEMVFSLALPEAIGGGSSQGGGDGSTQSGEEAGIIYKARSKSIWKAIEAVQTEVENPLFFGHVQVRIFGEELARRGLGQSLDTALRMAEARRKTWAAVADGTAEEILKIKPKTKKPPALLVAETLETESYLNVIPPMRLADLSAAILNSGEQAVLPLIKAEKDNIVVSGAALFKDDKMVGKLNRDEMRYFLLVSAGKGFMQKQVELDNGDSFVFQFSNVKRKIKPHLNGKQISFTISLEIEGNILESSSKHSLTEGKLFEHVQQVLSEALEKDCRSTLHKVQKEFQVDSYRLGTIVRARYPKIWKEIDWNQEFPNVPIKVEVHALIRRLGMATR